MIKRLLRIAERHLERGTPVPLDVLAKLAEFGFEISAFV